MSADVVQVTHGEFAQAMAWYSEQNPDQRVGQVAYNVLYTYNRSRAAEIIHTGADPFYDDTRLPMFYTVLAEKGFLV